VFYDEECAFCRRTVAVLRSFDLFDALKPVPGVSTDPMRESYPQISGQMLTTDVYVADRGRIAFAYDAYAWIAKRMLLFWPIGAIMQIPFVARLGRRAYRRVADARHCTSAAPQAKRKAATLDTPSILIHRVGPALFGCQLAVSSLLLLYSLRDVYLPSNVPRLGAVRRLVNGFAKRRPVWPFDLYPTFTPATQSDLDIWEARWVTSNGREIRVSPTAYYSAFGNAGLAWNMTRWGIFRGGDPEESRARSLGLVRLLWQRELPSVQPNITGAKVYRVEYRLQPPAGRFPAALVAQRILYAFPLPSITGNSIRLSATVSQTASPPRNPPR
jgi:predicted DCC family thiol-disulfide oxidoreductase YuxK